MSIRISSAEVELRRRTELALRMTLFFDSDILFVQSPLVAGGALLHLSLI